MKKYPEEEVDAKDIPWTKFKIIVPTQEDKQELMDSFEHFHDEGYDPELITPNQLAHEYINGSNIEVNPKLFITL